MASDHESWREEKTQGPGRDDRVLPLQRDSQRRRYRTLTSAMTDMTEKTQSDWPFRGPRAIGELLTAVRASGEELVSFHEFYIRISSLDPTSAVATHHKSMVSVLAHLLMYDQLDALNLAAGELCARTILQIHRAVRRAPRNPDFRGLQLMTDSQLVAAGNVLTGEFAKWTAEEQKAESFTLKQQRLYAEETTHDKKGKGQSENQKGQKDKKTPKEEEG